PHQQPDDLLCHRVVLGVELQRAPAVIQRLIHESLPVGSVGGGERLAVQLAHTVLEGSGVLRLLVVHLETGPDVKGNCAQGGNHKEEQEQPPRATRRPWGRTVVGRGWCRCHGATGVIREKRRSCCSRFGENSGGGRLAGSRPSTRRT